MKGWRLTMSNLGAATKSSDLNVIGEKERWK